MLKREVPTGPAVDLLRKLLEKGHLNSKSSIDEAYAFLAGTPAHSPLPWSSGGTTEHGGLRTVVFNGDTKIQTVARDLSNADAELVLTACNNFYALRDAAEELLEALVQNRQPSRTTAQVDALQVLIATCGASPEAAFESFEVMRPYTPAVMPPPPVPPMPSAPAMPLPYVGTNYPRENTILSNIYRLYLTPDELQHLGQGTAQPAPR